jgi:TonB family protein
MKCRSSEVNGLGAAHSTGWKVKALGVPLSLALHAAGAVGLMVLWLALSEALPEPHVVSSNSPLPRVVIVRGRAEASGGNESSGVRRPDPQWRGRRIRIPAVSRAVVGVGDPFPPDSDDGAGPPIPCWENCAGPDSLIGDGDGPQAPSAQKATDKPVRIGGRISEPRRVSYVEPLYPDLAKAARAQGQVVLECTLSVAGTVEGITVVGGHPLLRNAAVEAVRRWRYVPTLLNGVPVAVVLRVTVDFRLH